MPVCDAFSTMLELQHRIEQYVVMLLDSLPRSGLRRPLSQEQDNSLG